MAVTERRGSRSRMWPLAAGLGVAVLVTGLGGGLLVARASSRAWPASPTFRETPGTVVALTMGSCGTKTRPWTCYRPIVEYSVESRTLQTAARTRYRPAPFKVGDSVTVLLGSGEVWLKPEWESKEAAARDDVRRDKMRLYILGSLLIGGALFGLALVAAVLTARPGADAAGAADAQAPVTADEAADEA